MDLMQKTNLYAVECYIKMLHHIGIITIAILINIYPKEF